MVMPMQDSRADAPAAHSSARDAGYGPAVRHSLALLAALAAVAALKLAQDAVVPVLVAMFLSLLLAPAVDFLTRRRVPRPLAAGLLMAALIAVVAVAINATWRPARAWLDTAPATLRQLEAKLRPVTRFIAKVETVSTQAGRVTEPSATSGEAPTPVSVEPKSIVQSTQEWAITIVSMTFLMFFLLATDLAAAALARGPPGSPWAHTAQVIVRVRAELGRYFAAVTFSNLILGVGTAAAMYLLDMPNPLLWGVLAFVLNFVPYAGSAVTLTLITIVALVSFEGVGQALAVAGTYLVLTTLEGQVLQPVLVGRRLDVSPLVVLIGLWFGGWLWGIAGIALAMPVVVSAKAALQEIVRSRSGDAAAVETDTVRGRASEWLRHSARRKRSSDTAASASRAAK